MIRACVCALALLGSAYARGQTLWKVDSASSEQKVGSLAGLGPGFAVALKEPAANIPSGELISLRQVLAPRPGRPDAPMLMLANGDCWPGKLLGGKGLALEWNWHPDAGTAIKLSANLPSVRAIWLTPPPNPDADPASYDWVDAEKKQDTLRLRNGDVLRGTLETISPDGAILRFRVEGEKAAKPLETDNVVAIVFDPSLIRMKPPKTTHAKIAIRNGSRLTVTEATSDGKTLAGVLSTGGNIAVAIENVVSLDILQGKATYLSDLAPKTSRVEPFNDLIWNWKPNRNVRGEPLRLNMAQGVEAFDRGLGTHSKTILEYDLAGKYRIFEATVGLDARTGKKGEAEVSILLDGKKVPLPALVNLKAGPAVPVRIVLANAKTLTLVIDFGPGGDVQDDVNWGDARLVE